MCFRPKVDTSFLDFQKEEAEAARLKEEERQGRVDTGMTAVGDVFDNMQPILDQRSAALHGFFDPQIDKQFGNAKDELVFALKRAGLLTSTTAGKRQVDLGDEFALQKSKILGDIQSDLAGTKTRMQQQRASIEAGLRSSGDATAATNAALQSAVTFREDSPTFSPLGNIFANLNAGIGSYNTGREVTEVRRLLARPNPLNSSSGRMVG